MAVYLVTGGAGFIGSHLVEALVRRGDTVRVYDDFSTGRRANLAPVEDHVHIIEGSIRDRDALYSAMQGVEYVLHHGAVASVPQSIRDPLGSHETNATGTLNVLQAARDTGVRRVIYAGSSSAYGDQPGECKTEAMCPQALSPYAASKLAGEYFCAAYAKAYGLETVIFRYFNVFGPRQDPTSEYSAVIPIFATRLLRGVAPTIYGDGLQTRDFIYIDNVVRANLLACAAPAERVVGQVFNIAAGGRTTLLDLIAALNRMIGSEIAPQFKPERVGDIRHSQADISKAQQLLGFNPEISLEEGLARTLEWFGAHADT